MNTRDGSGKEVISSAQGSERTQTIGDSDDGRNFV